MSPICILSYVSHDQLSVLCIDIVLKTVKNVLRAKYWMVRWGLSLTIGHHKYFIIVFKIQMAQMEFQEWSQASHSHSWTWDQRLRSWRDSYTVKTPILLRASAQNTKTPFQSLWQVALQRLLTTSHREGVFTQRMVLHSTSTILCPSNHLWD